MFSNLQSSVTVDGRNNNRQYVTTVGNMRRCRFRTYPIIHLGSIY
jgi:hypothetical protein